MTLFIRHRVIPFVVMLCIAGVAGWFLSLYVALAAWAGFVVAGCLAGAALLASQPVGRATPAGQLGAKFVRWGFRVGKGRLPHAVAVSIVIWLIIGAAVILAVASRGNLAFAALVVALAANALALCYTIGVVLSSSSIPRFARSLGPVMLVLLGTSAAGLWLHFGAGRTLAGAGLAAAPILLVGGGYGAFLAVMLVGMKRGARWN
jgi:hypothetical protein